MATEQSADGQLDLFSVQPGENLTHQLDREGWPPGERFPLNRGSETVRTHVWRDLVGSSRPLVIAGYSSIDRLVDLAAAWQAAGTDGDVRVVLGAEPFATRRLSFGSPAQTFTREAHEYWYARGISLRLSAKVVSALDLLAAGRLRVRFVHGHSALHAKVYVGEQAATVGSSNFTHSGLSSQVEANARFDRTDDPARYAELARIGDNLWEVGQDWTDPFRELLEHLLQVVPWQEALARAAAELLEGEWAREYLAGLGEGLAELWPSQRVGIAQAMWIIQNVGSVLVADATGSGKTRMGAHLVRAVRDRIWQTGRTRRRDLTALVCPPAVEPTWRTEALRCGLTINTVSHGRLSRTGDGGPHLAKHTVRGAQLLAVDEAHNFLNASSNRTQFLRQNLADHVVLFTATPISRGAGDLLDLVALLGPDNFDDTTHEVLRRLERGRLAGSLDPDEAARLRAEVQRFTLRRTKRQINELVDADPDEYVHPVTGRVCRYPEHLPDAYETGETKEDVAAAEEIRSLAHSLRGIALLPRSLAVPASMRRWFTDEQWLSFRMRSAAGLAAHHVMAALRSSRAALHEHLYGTTSAVRAYGLAAGFKSDDTGDRLSRTLASADHGPPTEGLDCELPDWLAHPAAWQQACEEEAEVHRRIGALLERIGPAREERKAELLRDLAHRRRRVLAFDRHLITLAVMQQMLGKSDTEVIIATGQAEAQRRRVQRLFAPDASDEDREVIALCSDAMNEGLNLQGAAAVVHLDLPTTLRVAEQRVGRVDRMDSPHDQIEAWWPRDGHAFATRSRERLVERLEESRTLLGQNMPVPDLGGRRLLRELDDEDELLDLAEVQREVQEALEQPDDDLTDALEPVRNLVEGEQALVSAAEYARQRIATHRVLSRVAPVASDSVWAFFAVRTARDGAPRWMFIEPGAAAPCLTDLPQVAGALRRRLEADPANRVLDDRATKWLDACLDVARRGEVELLPRRLQRALRQMQTVTTAWKQAARRAGDEPTGQRWKAIAGMLESPGDGDVPDPASIAERWLELTADRMEEFRAEHPRRRYVLIDDVTSALVERPLPIGEVEAAVSTVDAARPLAERVSACILGVPSNGS